MNRRVDSIVIRGGTVVDGTGGAGVPADVRLENGVVTGVGQGLTADRVIDASDQIVAPGFIDAHTHYDAQVLWDPMLPESGRHGVTTVVVGNCGFGVAPCRPQDREVITGTLQHVEGMDKRVLDAGIQWSFETFGEYLAAIRQRGTGLNFGAYIGHTAVRLWTMGLDSYERSATDDEVRVMCELVVQAIDEGALGFSTSGSATHNGVDGKPVPSRLAAVAELEAIVDSVGRRQIGVLQVIPGDLPVLREQQRSEDFEGTPGSQIRLEDALQWNQRTGLPVLWTALVTNRTGTYRRALEMTQDARRMGLAVWAQVGPRPVSLQFDLMEPFPWDLSPIFAALHGHDIDHRRACYGDESWRQAAAEALDRSPQPPMWDRIFVDESELHPDLVGQSLSSLANSKGSHPLDVGLRLAMEDNLKTRLRAVVANGEPDDVAWLLGQDGVTLGLSDAGAHSDQIFDGCFPTDLLANIVRQRGALTLEGAVRKLTGELADIFGLSNRGYLREGAAADVVVFDPSVVGPGPLRRVHDLPAGGARLVADQPTGINTVIVNGVVIGGEEAPFDGSGERPGQLLVAGAR